MKSNGVFALLALTQGVSAHYFFENVMINGGAQSSMKYIRRFTRQTWYNPIKFSSNPAADIRDNSYIDVGDDARCNQGAFNNAGNTEVLTVNAGSELRVRLNGAGNFQHPGPSLVYMSKAPNGNVKSYAGDGDWFKIFQEGVCNTGADFTNSAWCSHGKNSIAARIPADTPNGEYLVRFEHIGVHRSHVNQPEHYLSCVQVKVQGGGNGTPGPMVRFPGAYKKSDPYATMSVYNGVKPFTFPGPAVWTGGNSGGGGSNGGGSNGGGSNGGGSNGGGSNGGGSSGGGSCSAMYGQCGGKDWKGATCCSSGSCKATNEYYSQCV